MREDHRLIKSAKSARDGNVSEATIPADIITLADQACHECYDHNSGTWFDLRDIIARAILAERFACAKIAETGKPAIIEISPERWVDITDDYGDHLGQIREGRITRQDWRKGISEAILRR